VLAAATAAAPLGLVVLSKWIPKVNPGFIRYNRARSRFDQSEQRSSQRVGFLVHELRNLVNTALVAFEVFTHGGSASMPGAGR
jgi:hypothetical protein